MKSTYVLRYVTKNKLLNFDPESNNMNAIARGKLIGLVAEIENKVSQYEGIKISFSRS